MSAFDLTNEDLIAYRALYANLGEFRHDAIVLSYYGYKVSIALQKALAENMKLKFDQQHWRHPIYECCMVCHGKDPRHHRTFADWRAEAGRALKGE